MRLWKWLSASGAGLALLAGSVPCSAQDFDASPNYGTVTLRGGSAPDPHRVALQAGGDIDAAARIDQRCVGFISNAPDLRVHYVAGGAPLVLSVTSPADTTLVVNAPDGRWHCNDDGAGAGLNPVLRIERPASGRYEIWVGRYGTRALHEAQLEIGSGRIDGGGWILSEHRWQNATDAPSRHFLRNGTAPGSLHYLLNGTAAGSFHFFFNGGDPGSHLYFRNGTGIGSLHYWRHGTGPGSQYYWTHGTGCLSEYLWRYGTSGNAANGCSAGSPVIETLLVLCLTGRLDIAPCGEIDAVLQEEELRHTPPSPDRDYWRRLQEIRRSAAG
ncbi:hypothetical protein [Sphingosinicella terrae]|uniref:hypothetical protein n=1 Tax=Sphingosinicella terrae TaxID=2172047 RepID=UPI002548B5B4|nr:hypothetical protein [Sphingosinicella terrae]